MPPSTAREARSRTGSRHRPIWLRRKNAVDAVRNRLEIFGQTDEQIAGSRACENAESRHRRDRTIDGIVTDRQVGPGQYLQVGNSTPVYTIGDLASVWLVADVREIDAPLVEIGQKSKFASWRCLAECSLPN